MLTPHDHAQAILDLSETGNSKNEADTRHQIIDGILHDVLSWPRYLTKCEEYVAPGYADYILQNRSQEPVLVIEAKKEDFYFELPCRSTSDQACRFEKIKTLLTSDNIKQAITQARNYCSDIGCEFGAVSNGRQWIFFRVFEKGKNWKDLQAFVIDSLNYFVDSYIEATNRLSFNAITNNASLRELLGDSIGDRRPKFFPKSRIESYDQEVLRNHLAKSIRPIIERYFGKMNPHDDAFMSKCYISRREYRESEENVRQVIDDTLSPFFRDYNIHDLFEEKEGEEFFERIPSGLRDKKSRDVIVLFGGKGSGKSTLASRILFHRPPNSIKYFAKPIVVDLLECPEDNREILDETYRQLLEGLDSDGLLKSERDVLLELFADKFQIAKKQDLAGFNESSDIFNKVLNELVASWKSDAAYVAARLSDYWKKKQKGVVIVLDNTDQYSPEKQEYCFTLAHSLASKLDCLVIISMREERFFVSRIAGTLDAFHNSGFHLTSPSPKRLFISRLTFVLRLLDDCERVRQIAPELSNSQIDHLKVLLRIFVREFRQNASHLSVFIRACAHGNMRLALDFFREFVLSGYTRVDEMLNKPSWTLQVHQVLRPMMVPYRLFYEEEKSNVPNVFQIRSPERGSNLTGLRLLNYLSRGQSPNSPSYVPIAKIRSHFANLNFLDDAECNLDVFLRAGVVESNKRMDFFSEEVDAVKITAYGTYLLEVLSHNFSYLELVCLDCGIHDESTSGSLAQCGNDDVRLFFEGKKRERIDVRLQKVRFFLDYLEKEEQLEHEYFFQNSQPKLIPSLRQLYSVDEKKVATSASRNYSRNQQVGDLYDEFGVADD